MSLFSGKTVLITGGTGSFGTAALERLLSLDAGHIRIVSRDAGKQEALQAKFASAATKLSFYAGDIADRAFLKEALCEVDYVFHAAALKDIPGCEKAPLDAVRTNITGTANVLELAVAAGVRAVVYLSTDKAAYPVNVMGNTKAIGEKVAVALSGTGTRIVCTRFGNVLCSQGSVVPLWMRQIAQGKPVTVTDPEMTRFIMTIREAVDLVIYAFENGESGDILVQKSPACTIGLQAQAVNELCGGLGVVVVGARPGEKRYETLLTREEGVRAIDMGGFYRIPAEAGSGIPLPEYNSDNAPRLSLSQIKDKLREAIAMLSPCEGAD